MHRRRDDRRKGNQVVSPVTGNLVSHATVSSFMKHKCRCGPCKQMFRDNPVRTPGPDDGPKGMVTRRRVRRDGNNLLAPSEWSCRMSRRIAIRRKG